MLLCQSKCLFRSVHVLQQLQMMVLPVDRLTWSPLSLREAPFPPNSGDVSDDDKSEQSELLSAKPGTQELEALEPAAEQTPGADSGQSAEAAERDRQPVVMEHQVGPVAEQMPEALAAEQMLVEAPVAEQMPEALVAEHVPGRAGPEVPVAEPGPVQGGVQRDLRQERRDANATDDSEGDDDNSHELHHRRQAVPLLRPLRDPAVVANARRPVSFASKKNTAQVDRN